MRAPGQRGGCAPWLGLLLTAASLARAEEPAALAAVEVARPRDLLQARLRYGVAIRSGLQLDDVNPAVGYGGLTPNDLALQAWGWPLLGAHLGGWVSVQREAFGLYDQTNRIASVGLIRASGGPAGRLILGPVKLEAAVGYSFHQLPTLIDGPAPRLATATRRGVLLAARGIVDLGPVGIEARGEVPITLAAFDGFRAPATSWGFEVGAAIRLQLLRTGSVLWGLLADFSYASDDLRAAGGLTVNQTMIRLGGALDLKWQDPPAPEGPPPAPRARFGQLELRVVDADTGAAVPGTQLALGGRTLVTDPAGLASASELLPGAVSVLGTAGGYLEGQVEGTIEAGGLLSLTLRLKKEPPRLGSVLIKVTAKEANSPLGRATVKLGEVSVLADEQGTARFSQLPPGPLGIRVSAEGFTPAEEAASVVAGQTSELTIALVGVKKRVPATITGLVRSTVGGRPVAAELEIPQARLKTRADASGSFTFELEGGTYTVEISARGYLRQSKSVTVKDGDQAIFNVDLHPR